MSKIPEIIPEKDFSNFEGETYNTEIKDLIGIQRLIRKHLYTKPIQTPVQEMLCNALDAMEMSGKEDQPIKVYLPDLSDGMFKIRDFGPGLSDDQVKNIYANIGVSTKRKNKKAIGCWGYGSKAFFAYTSKFFVISYYNGIETTFLAKINEDDSSSFELKHKRETNEPNGLEIQCPVKDEDIPKFCESVARCCLFWKVHPIIFGDAWKPRVESYLEQIKNPLFSLNHGRVYNFTSELKNIIGVRQDIIINAGYIPYNLLESVYQEENIKKLPKNKELTIVIDYDIEDLRIPPGREFLEDNKENLKLLSDGYSACLTEYEEYFYKKIELFSDLEDLQKAAKEYNDKVYFEEDLRKFRNKEIEYNGQKYYINNSYKLKWKCHDLGFFTKKGFSQEVEYGEYGRKRTRTTSDFGLKRIENLHELDYNAIIPAIVYINPMWSDRKQKASVKSLSENCAGENSLFPFPNKLTKENIVFTFKHTNTSLAQDINSIKICHIIDTGEVKWPASKSSSSKTLAKIIKLDDEKFWFNPCTCDIETLQGQIIGVFRGSYKSHFKSLSYTYKQAVGEMKKLYKLKTGQNLDIYYISSGIDKKLKKLNITYTTIDDEMKKYLKQEDIDYFNQPIKTIKVPYTFKQLINLPFIDRIQLSHLDKIKEIIERQQELELIEVQFKGKELPRNILSYFGYTNINKIEVTEGDEIEKDLKTKYPFFMKTIDSDGRWLNLEENVLAKEQFIKAWNNEIKGQK